MMTEKLLIILILVNGVTAFLLLWILIVFPWRVPRSQQHIADGTGTVYRAKVDECHDLHTHDERLLDVLLRIEELLTEE